MHPLHPVGINWKDEDINDQLEEFERLGYHRSLGEALGICCLRAWGLRLGYDTAAVKGSQCPRRREKLSRAQRQRAIDEGMPDAAHYRHLSGQ